MNGAIGVPLFMLLALVSASATGYGRNDTVPESNDSAIFLRFLISSLNGYMPLIGGIRVNDSLPIAFLDPDGVTRDPMGFVGEISEEYPELAYMHRHEEYFKRYREENNDYESEILVEAGCLFVPRFRKCQIVQKINTSIGPSTFVSWNGTELVVSDENPDGPGDSLECACTANATDARQRAVLETYVHLLRTGAEEIHRRWSAVYARILNAATGYSSTLIFEYSPDPPRDLVCQLRAAAPLAFYLVIEGPGLKPIMSEEAITIRECTAAMISTALPPEGYDVSQLVCRVLSPAPWNMSIKGPQVMYVDTGESGIVKEYVTGSRFYYAKTTCKEEFAGVVNVCSLATFMLAGVGVLVATFLFLRHERIGCVPDDILCEGCRKKLC